MKRLLLHTLWMGALVVLGAVALMYQADGNADAYYMRFATPPPNSLITGTSRPAQGFRPEVLNEELPGRDLFNFAFTLSHSPYGPAYLEAIRTKLRKDASGGVFILSVDPWSVSSQSEDPNDVSAFRERGNFLTLDEMSLHPNAWYLLEHYGRPWFYLLLDSEPAMFLHRDGWLEISVPMDSASVADRIRSTVDYWKERLDRYAFSSLRMAYLEKTIAYLQERGEVYLVRLPVPPEMMKLDESLMPDFDARMRELSRRYGAPYLDLTPHNAEYRYVDGNHLWKEDGAEVSRRVARWIKAQD